MINKYPTVIACKSIVQSFVCLGCVALITPLTAAFPQPTLFYNFDSSGGDNNEYVSSVNSSAEIDLRMFGYDSGVDWRESLTMSGGGVSGASGDRALDLSAATGMGRTNNYGGGAFSAAGLDTVVGSKISSLTIAGWLYASNSPLHTNAQIVNLANASTDGFRLSGFEGGELQFNYAGEKGRRNYTTDTGSWNAVGEWMFFAVVLDTTVTVGNNLTFYVGGRTGNLEVAYSVRSEDGPIVIGDRSFTLGNFTGVNNPASNRPFQGYMDEFGFWFDSEGGAGALNYDQVDAFRLAAIPEPGVVTLMSGGFAWLLAVALRRRFRIGSNGSSCN